MRMIIAVRIARIADKGHEPEAEHIKRGTRRTSRSHYASEATDADCYEGHRSPDTPDAQYSGPPRSSMDTVDWKK